MKRSFLPYTGRHKPPFDLREVGVVTTAKRKQDLAKLRKKYRRDLEDLRALAERKSR